MKLEDFGTMTNPMPENKIEYDLRALDAYCEERHIHPVDLSPDELAKFETSKEKKIVNF